MRLCNVFGIKLIVWLLFSKLEKLDLSGFMKVKLDLGFKTAITEERNVDELTNSQENFEVGIP